MHLVCTPHKHLTSSLRSAYSSSLWPPWGHYCEASARAAPTVAWVLAMTFAIYCSIFYWRSVFGRRSTGSLEAIASSSWSNSSPADFVCLWVRTAGHVARPRDVGSHSDAPLEYVDSRLRPICPGSRLAAMYYYYLLFRTFLKLWLNHLTSTKHTVNLDLCSANKTYTYWSRYIKTDNQTNQEIVTFQNFTYSFGNEQ